MAPKDSSDCVVTVTIEIGHKADCLDVPTNEGFTHDWTAFVKRSRPTTGSVCKESCFPLTQDLQNAN